MELYEYVVYGGFALFLYYVGKSYFSSKADLTAQVPVVRRKRLTQKRDFKLEELRAFDGSDPTSPILMAVKGKVYDVTNGAGFYGPGGAYHAFAGRDASRALAKGSTESEEADNTNLGDLTQEEKDTLNEWESHYQMKYEVVGNLV